MSQPLTELEQWVLLATLHLGDEAYAVTIREEIKRRTGAAPLRGSIYVTLERLETQGLLAARMGEPLAERGGKARRYFRARPAAIRALRESRHAYEQMWKGLAALVEKP